MATLLEQLSYMNDTKELIKEAIINKGVDVPARTPLRQYVDKIDEIQADPPTFTATDTGALSAVVCRDRLDIPTSVGDQPLSTTFTYTALPWAITFGCRRLYISDYFLSSNFGNIFSGRDSGTSLEEIHCDSVSVTSWGSYLSYLSTLKVMDFPKLTGSVGISMLTSGAVSDNLVVNMPELDNSFNAIIGNSTHNVALTLNVSKALTVGGDASSGLTDFLRYCTGDWEFPSATTFRNFAIPQLEQTMRFPSIASMSVTNAFNRGGTGMLHLYLGPDMSTCACAANLVTNAAYIDIHIPAGESTTKATLDAAGVAYTQDYEI